MVFVICSSLLSAAKIILVQCHCLWKRMTENCIFLFWKANGVEETTTALPFVIRKQIKAQEMWLHEIASRWDWEYVKTEKWRFISCGAFDLFIMKATWDVMKTRDRPTIGISFENYVETVHL